MGIFSHDETAALVVTQQVFFSLYIIFEDNSSVATHNGEMLPLMRHVLSQNANNVGDAHQDAHKSVTTHNKILSHSPVRNQWGIIGKRGGEGEGQRTLKKRHKTPRDPC